MTRDTVLRLAPELRIVLCGDRMTVESSNDAIDCSSDLLPVLCGLRSPCTLEAVLGKLTSPSPQDWMSASAHIIEMIGAGMIVCDDKLSQAQLPDHGFGFLEPHLGMMEDKTRTRLYIEAIQRTVKPGDVVLDLGTGVGVLAIAAVRAGARHVYAVERTAIADVAERMFHRNGVADRVTLIRENSTRVSLPERATVMTSELLGTDPLSERILEYTGDALRRLLDTSARIVPRRLRVLARAVQLPEELVTRHVADSEATKRWEASYSMDFSAFRQVSLSRSPWFTISADEAVRWPAVSPTIELFNLDLTKVLAAAVRATRTTAVSSPGRLDAINVFWDLELDQFAHLSTDPLDSIPSCSWGSTVWLMADRPQVFTGQKLEMSFCYSAPRSIAEVKLVKV